MIEHGLLRACCIAGRYHGDLVAAAQGPASAGVPLRAGVRRGVRVQRRGCAAAPSVPDRDGGGCPYARVAGRAASIIMWERAHANKRWLLAELAAQPICTGQVMPAF